MITIGVDAHKQVHVAVALDKEGKELGQWRGENTVEGWGELKEWASSLGDSRQWGIEGAWNYGRGLAQCLIEASETVYEVNPRWTAFGRRHARKRDKNDRLDARSVALLVWRESSELPKVVAEDETAVLSLLVGERDNALAEATRLRNQIHQLLLHLDPEYKAHLPSLKSKAGVDALESYTPMSETALQQERAAAVRRLAERLRLALEQASDLARQIRELAKARFSALTELFGVNLLTAGALAAALGPGLRFRSEAQLAAYSGAAPVEASSAGSVRHRLNRGGNRQLNAILYRIGLTQARGFDDAKKYLKRRISEGKSKREAMRALKRYLVRAVWRLWQKCWATPGGDGSPEEQPVGAAA